jgi:hypothetical protein
VDLRDGVWLYLCHRASCPTKGAVPAVGNDGRILLDGGGSMFKPRPLLERLRLPKYGDGGSGADPISLRLYGDGSSPPLIDRGLHPFALHHGLRVLENEPGTHAWIVGNAKGVVIGHVTRTADKRVLTWRDADSPFYGVYYPPSVSDRQRTVLVVEDPLSAALLAEEGYTAVCLHGTNLARDAAQEIVHGLDKDVTYLVALDPDEAGRKSSQRVLDRLNVAGAKTAWQWLLARDVNKMTIPERRALADEIDRTLKQEDDWQNTHT